MVFDCLVEKPNKFCQMSSETILVILGYTICAVCMLQCGMMKVGAFWDRKEKKSKSHNVARWLVPGSQVCLSNVTLCATRPVRLMIPGYCNIQLCACWLKDEGADTGSRWSFSLLDETSPAVQWRDDDTANSTVSLDLQNMSTRFHVPPSTYDRKGHA